MFIIDFKFEYNIVVTRDTRFGVNEGVCLLCEKT